MRMGTTCWIAGAIACGVASLAQGEIRTFAMEGNVASIQNPTGALDFVHSGDRVVYTFTFDSNAPDQSPAPNEGVYSFTSSSLSVQGLPIPSTPRGIGIQHPLDLFDVSSDVVLTGLFSSTAFFELLDQFESSALSDTSLPTVPYPLESFHQGAGFLIQGFGPAIPPDSYPSLSYFDGSIDRFYAVPEPSSVLLLCLASFLLNRRTAIRS